MGGASGRARSRAERTDGRTHAREGLGGGGGVSSRGGGGGGGLRDRQRHAGGWRRPRTSSTGWSTPRAGAPPARSAARASPRTRSAWPSWCRCGGRFVRGGLRGRTGGLAAGRPGLGAAGAPAAGVCPSCRKSPGNRLELGAVCFVKRRNRFRPRSPRGGGRGACGSCGAGPTGATSFWRVLSHFGGDGRPEGCLSYFWLSFQHPRTLIFLIMQSCALWCHFCTARSLWPELFM